MAKALLEPSNDRYKGLNIPLSNVMREKALEFLQHNTSLHRGGSIWNKYYKDGKMHVSTINFIHHTLHQKAYDDPLRYKAIYGRQKYIDPRHQRTIQDFKDAIKYASSRNDKRLLKEKLREFQKSVTQNRWEVEARKFSVIPRNDPALSRKNALDSSKFLKQYNIEKLKMQRTQLAASGETFWEKQFDGDPGEAIGKGQEIKESTTDPKDWVRLGDYLKKARFIKLSVYKGIMAPKNRALRTFLKEYIGTRKYNEFFLSHNAAQKYATNAYFKPGSEYGRMRAHYDNTKGEVSPLQRMRKVTKSGKEILKYNEK